MNRVSFTIHCDDRRYCANGAIAVEGNDIESAYQQAREQGWIAGLQRAVCPSCYRRKHGRREA